MPEHPLQIIDLYINDEDGDELCEGFGVRNTEDGQVVFITMDWYARNQWVTDHWREYADQDVIAEYDYGLT
jgi:hypothetical protein